MTRTVTPLSSVPSFFELASGLSNAGMPSATVTASLSIFAKPFSGFAVGAGVGVGVAAGASVGCVPIERLFMYV
ncbi:MAG: hypothetical protein BWY81_01446 [Firmicutes bacterium ADurb.Bin467]|nr:MAG: hypothetical protein BWY81_01446 [Firmicutes bacterium ADurb.Bin467]